MRWMADFLLLQQVLGSRGEVQRLEGYLAIWRKKNHTILHTVHRLAPFKFHLTHINWPHLWKQKTGWISKQVWSDRFLSFPPVSLVWVTPTRRHSQYPCPEFDTAALLSKLIIMLVSWSRDWSRQLKNAPFPCQSGCKYAPGPTEPPRMPNFQQMSMI